MQGQESHAEAMQGREEISRVCLKPNDTGHPFGDTIPRPSSWTGDIQQADGGFMHGVQRRIYGCTGVGVSHISVDILFSLLSSGFELL